MMPSQRIEDVIRNVRVTTNAATDERVTNAVEAAIKKQNEQRSASVRTGGVIRRFIMKSNWTKLATAAAVIVAIGLGMYALTGSVDVATITMAQIRQAMEGIDWMQIVNKGGNENEIRDQSPQIDWFSFVSKVHIGLCKGIVEYDDFKTGKRLWWNPAGKYICEDPINDTRQFAHGATGPFEMMDKSLLHAAHGSDVTKELGTYQGRKVEVWTASNNVKGQPGYTRTLTVYIDIDRKLPIAATYDHNQPDGTVLRESDIEFKYPNTGPADIYEAGAPRTAKIKPSEEQ
jgi:hypothetical protein